MTQIGAISVKISADDSEFQRANKRTQSGIGEMAGKLRASANQYAKWGAAAGAAAALAAAAIWKSTATQIDALTKHADKIGISVEALQALRFAAEQTGVSTGALDTALQRMTRRVAEAANGTGEAAGALKELGLDAQVLKSLAPDEAFSAISEAMEGVAGQGDRVRLAMRLFDTEGVGLVNTMKGGAAAIQGFKDEAEALGLTLSRVDAAKVEMANDSLNRVNKIIQGGLQVATAEFAPIVAALADEFKDLILESGGFGSIIGRVMDYGTKAVGVFANGLRGIQIIAKGLEAAFEGFAFVINRVFLAVSRSIDRLINGSISAINGLTSQLNKVLPGEGIAAINAFLNPATKLFDENTQYWSEAMQVSLKEMHDLAMQPLPSTGIEAWVQEVRAKAETVAKAMAAAAGGSAIGEAGGSTGLTSEQRAALEERIEAIRQAGLTESQILQEKYALDAESLYTALENQVITQEQFDLLAQENAMRHQEALTAIDQQGADARNAILESERQAKLAVIQGMFSNLSTLMNTGSKKLFEIGKAASIANALVSGYEAVVSSYAAGSKIGGPPVGAAFAATAAIATMAQIKQIKSQKLGGAGGGAVNFQNGQPSVNANGGGAVGPQQPSRNISISLTGSSFGAGGIRDLISEINAAVGDGVALRVT